MEDFGYSEHKKEIYVTRQMKEIYVTRQMDTTPTSFLREYESH